MFLVSIIKFFLFKKRQIGELTILGFLSDNKNTMSTFNIHKRIFPNKNIEYIDKLLKELESEDSIRQINIGGSNTSNRLWEYIREE